MTEFNGFDDLADDFQEFANQLEEFADRVDDAVDAGVERTAFQVEASAKRRAPVESGTLRGSIEARRLDIGAWAVGTNVDYAADVEMGTSPHVIEADNGEFLYFEGEDGHLIRKRSVNHPGTEAQPYLRPSLREHESELVENIHEEMEALAREVFST